MRPHTLARRWRRVRRRAASTVARHVPLPTALRLLHVLKRFAPSGGRGTAFAHDSLGLRGRALRDWFERAWWGHQANSLVGIRLDRRDTRDVDPLVDPIDWTPAERLLETGRGLIFLGAHLGPGRLAPFVVGRRFPDGLFVFWRPMPALADHRILLASRPETRRRLLVNLLAQLRRGGVVFLPAVGQGDREPIRQRVLDGTVNVSGSAAALARVSRAACLPVAPRWVNGRMQLRLGDPITPRSQVPDEWEAEFRAAWASWLEDWLVGPPENLGLRRTGFFPVRPAVSR